jgi:hypothetical protein
MTSLVKCSLTHPDFPITIVIFYMYDANFIDSIPVKNSTKEELLHACQIVNRYLSQQGFQTTIAQNRQ